MYKNLKSAILDSDDSVAAFARHNSINAEYLGEIIKGHKNPSKSIIDMLIMATGKPYEYLFREDEDMTKWEDRHKNKLPATLKLDWEIATRSLRGEGDPDKGTLERWKRQLKHEKAAEC